MTTRQFNESVNAEIRRMTAQQGEPTSFSEWLERNNDSIDDIGGNVVPDRVKANEDWQAERDRDLEHESRQDYATWERDGDTGSDQQGE